MMSRTFLNRLIILTFLGILGVCLGKAIYHQSVVGIILAIVSLIATVCFLYILAKANLEMKQQKEAGK